MADLEFGQLDVRYADHETLALGGGVELSYEVRGEGPAVVMLNNFAMVSPFWHGFTTQLEGDFQLINYDLRNQGNSKPGPEKVRFVDHVEDLKALLDHLKVDRTYLIGTSISTLIVRDFALRYPERVAGLVLVGPAFSPNGGLRRELVTRSWVASLDSGGIPQFFNHLYAMSFCDQTINGGGLPAYLALRDSFASLFTAEGIKENFLASLELDDNPELLSQITAPTLLILGDGDFSWSESVVEDALARIPGSRAVTLARAGHVPFFDDPDGFQKATGEFLRELVAAGQHVPA
ncbi:alpha/beta fold hydrolase [Streptomyces buecherae]|uniref:Alpha/beta hydrolase n=1 Tax=Streptomyces buecherae TaxID=2763006 RepID=A0A7H8N5V6_9ACTN|nr:alpha/beta hydrolase [Streptomyces buecherae]MBC3988212.1 alpha/beta hydrolase [Streptomyces buecherae]QKW49739.1 alpha/beta hydrolase [Streptomyces buecherae]